MKNIKVIIINNKMKRKQGMTYLTKTYNLDDFYSNQVILKIHNILNCMLYNAMERVIFYVIMPNLLYVYRGR